MGRFMFLGVTEMKFFLLRKIQHQNKRNVRKRKARKHILEKHFMAEAVEKLQLCSSCF